MRWSRSAFALAAMLSAPVAPRRPRPRRAAPTMPPRAPGRRPTPGRFRAAAGRPRHRELLRRPAHPDRRLARHGDEPPQRPERRPARVREQPAGRRARGRREARHRQRPRLRRLHAEAARRVDRPDRVVIDVQQLLGLADDVNVHIWYDPATMPKVAAAATRRAGQARPAERRLLRGQRAGLPRGARADHRQGRAAQGHATPARRSPSPRTSPAT